MPELLPNPESYDWIVVNSSAGKDSQAMLDLVVELAQDLDVIERVVVVHADLGRVEWKGTRDLAEEQAEHYGLRFETVSRPQGDLLEQIEARGRFPSPKQRYCTSDHKRGQVAKLLTALAKESREAGLERPTRILQCLGMRAEESPARAKLEPFKRDARNTNSRRVVDVWLPIQDWTVGQVWERIRRSGVRHHPAYDLGMPRLSCCFCIFAPRAALLLAGEHNPELLEEFCAVEERIDHSFTERTSLASIRDALAGGERSDRIQDWTM